MTYPNTLIFVDFPSDDPRGISVVLRRGLRVGGRTSSGRCVPSRSCLVSTSSSTTGARARSATCTWGSSTSPMRDRTPIRTASSRGRWPGTAARVRIWILVSDDDSQDRILATAERLGATVLWRNHFWAEFNGFNSRVPRSMG